MIATTEHAPARAGVELRGGRVANTDTRIWGVIALRNPDGGPSQRAFVN